MGERHVEDEHRGGLDLRDPRGRLGEVHGARAAQQLRVCVVGQTDLHPVLADLSALALETEHEVQAGVHRRELLHPDVLEDAEDRHLPRLIDQRVIGDDGEVEVHYFLLTGTKTFVLSHVNVITVVAATGWPSTTICGLPVGCSNAITN